MSDHEILKEMSRMIQPIFTEKHDLTQKTDEKNF